MKRADRRSWSERAAAQEDAGEGDAEEPRIILTEKKFPKTGVHCPAIGRINSTVSTHGFHRDQLALGHTLTGGHPPVGLELKSSVLRQCNRQRAANVDVVKLAPWHQ